MELDKLTTRELATARITAVFIEMILFRSFCWELDELNEIRLNMLNAHAISAICILVCIKYQVDDDVYIS